MLRFPRSIDRLFKLSRIFKASPGFFKYLRYSEYNDGVPGWNGYYEFLGRCIAFRDTDGKIAWLHEVR